MGNRGGKIECAIGHDTEIDRSLGTGIQGKNAMVEEKQRKLGQKDGKRIRRGPCSKDVDLYGHFE